MAKKEKKVKDVSLVLTQRSGVEKLVFGIMFVIFLLYAVVLITPFVWMMSQSFHVSASYPLHVSRNGPFTLPEVWQFSNYAEAFVKMEHNGVNFIQMIMNSLMHIAIGVFFGQLWPICTGYVFSKYRFRGREIMYAVAIFTMTVPIVGSSGAYYKLIAALHLYDTFPFFDIVTSINNGFGGNFLLYYGIFKSISWSYAEAVFIDGGNDYTVFVRIMLPQAIPAISALAITSAIGIWNEYAAIIMYKPSYLTVAAGLYYVSLNTSRIKPIYYAGLIISIIPVLVLFSFAAEGMMKNLSIGGIKG